VQILENLSSLPGMRTKNVPDGYTERIKKALNTFQYQLVFDSTEKKLVPLTPYKSGINPDHLTYAVCL